MMQIDKMSVHVVYYDANTGISTRPILRIVLAEKYVNQVLTVYLSSGLAISYPQQRLKLVLW
jgi:hypothetical protein